MLFLAAVFTVQLILLQNYSGRRRWLPLILCAAALLALELGILAVKYLFLSVFSGDGWSSPLLLVYSVFLLLLYFCLGGAVRRPPGSADISHFKEITHLIPTYMVQGKEKRAGGGSGPALLALERI